MLLLTFVLHSSSFKHSSVHLIHCSGTTQFIIHMRLKQWLQYYVAIEIPRRIVPIWLHVSFAPPLCMFSARWLVVVETQEVVPASNPYLHQSLRYFLLKYLLSVTLFSIYPKFHDSVQEYHLSAKIGSTIMIAKQFPMSINLL